ncbi:MAG TPA: YceI family protein, partial [Leptospiraceae bacterium]|nr:YceI family protein [Leptospiraceae bacterium]
DKSHTKVEFNVTHLTISDVTGRFDEFEGKGSFDEKTGVLSALDVKIKVKSINTNDEKRDDHLRSADFFDASKYSEITFVLTKPVTLVKGGTANLQGNLTMRGVTKPITLQMNYKGTVKDPWGNVKAGFILTGKVNRKDFGVSWSKNMDNGGAVVGDIVTINIAGEAAVK